MCVSSATLCSTTAGTALALGPLVLATKLPGHKGSPFSTLARDRAASAAQAPDSHSLGSASQIDWNPIVQVELDNISSVESSRSTCQNQVVVSDLLTLETCRPLLDTCTPIPPQLYLSSLLYYPISGRRSSVSTQTKGLCPTWSPA